MKTTVQSTVQSYVTNFADFHRKLTFGQRFLAMAVAFPIGIMVSMVSILAGIGSVAIVLMLCVLSILMTRSAVEHYLVKRATAKLAKRLNDTPAPYAAS